MKLQKFAVAVCVALLACSFGVPARAGSVFDYQYTIIPREVQSIVATMCNSATLDAAKKAYATLDTGGFNALVEKTRASIGKENSQSTRIKMILALKETLMSAIVVQKAIDEGKAPGGSAANAATRKEMSDIVDKTLKTMCVHVSNLDKILYDPQGAIKAGPYEGMLRELEKVARDARTPGM